jgi:drug/metabolite transporter (DMT)-like permease
VTRIDSAERERRRGLRLVMACALFWSLNGPFIKHLSAAPHHQTGLEIALWRSLFAGLAILPAASGGMRRLPRSAWWAPAIGGFAAMCGLFVSATVSTAAANAIILQYTAPFWIFVLSGPLLGERPRRHDWAVLPVAMAGILVIFIRQLDTDRLGLTLGLLSGAAFALVMLSLRRLRSADPLATPCVVNLATALLLAPLALPRMSLSPHPSTWLILAAMGVFQMAVPYWLLSHGLRRVQASEASLVSLSELLLNPLWTFLWVGERPQGSTLVGGALIVAALALKNRLDHRAAPRPEAAPT